MRRWIATLTNENFLRGKLYIQLAKTGSRVMSQPIQTRQGHRTAQQGNTMGSSGQFRRVGWFVGGALLLVGVGVGATTLGDPSSGAGEPESSSRASRILSVETAPVAAVSSYVTSREFTGTIVARRVSELSFERSGLLEGVEVDEGMSVQEGEVLARLDTEMLRTRREETVARRDQAVAVLEEMIEGPRQEDIDAARAQVESLKPEVELLKLQTNRSRNLLGRNAVAQDEFDRYFFGLQSKQGQLDQARHELEELINGTRQQQIDAQKAIVAQLEAAIDQIDVDLRKSTLRAPFAGAIARRFADEGAVLQAGGVVLKLVEDSDLEAWVGLPIEESSQMTVGSHHVVKISGRSFHVEVTGRRPEVDPATRTRTVILKMGSSASDYVVHGQVVRLQIEQTVLASGVWLPVTALTEGDRGLWSCLVAVPEDQQDASGRERFHIERRDVEVLHAESGRVLVRGTLSSDDRVVTSGTHRISVGQVVHLAGR